MLTLRSIKLFGYALIMLLVFQSVSARYDSHDELELSASHLPPHHQDAADGTPHLDHPQHTGHSAQELLQTTNSAAALAEISMGDHRNPDVAQDCSHCCHCHSNASLCLPCSHIGSATLRGSLWFAATDAGLPHGKRTALFRPPIA